VVSKLSAKVFFKVIIKTPLMIYMINMQHVLSMVGIMKLVE